MPTMTLAPTTPTLDPQVVEQVLIGGDLSKLTPRQKLAYYKKLCDSLGLNLVTQPFKYLTLSGKLTLYATKDCAEQLRRLHSVSIHAVGFAREVIEGMYVVTAPASLPSGRTDVSTGAVSIDGLKGEARANAMMKAETKAKRRVTLSICGLGMLDETEVEAIPDAQPVDVDVETGELVAEPMPPLPPPPKPTPAPPAGDASRMITPGQRARLFAIAKEHGWSKAQVMRVLDDRFQIASTKDIPMLHYDQVCAVFTVPAPPAVEEDLP